MSHKDIDNDKLKNLSKGLCIALNENRLKIKNKFEWRNLLPRDRKKGDKVNNKDFLVGKRNNNAKPYQKEISDRTDKNIKLLHPLTHQSDQLVNDLFRMHHTMTKSLYYSLHFVNFENIIHICKILNDQFRIDVNTKIKINQNIKFIIEKMKLMVNEHLSNSYKEVFKNGWINNSHILK